MTQQAEMMLRVSARADRAVARAGLAAGMSFDDVVSAVEDAVDIRLRVVEETDTRAWGALTGFLTVFAARREGSIHVRAADPALYRQFAVSHELGHLLDDAHCSGAFHQRSSVSPWGDDTLTAPEFETEMVAEHIAHRIAQVLYGSPRVAESSW